MLKILVVEDVPAMQTQIVNYLTRQLSGYAVVTARHRAEALQRVMDDKPNLILLDLVIPPDAADADHHCVGPQFRHRAASIHANRLLQSLLSCDHSHGVAVVFDYRLAHIGLLWCLCLCLRVEEGNAVRRKARR